jgi:hypothetical protein
MLNPCLLDELNRRNSWWHRKNSPLSISGQYRNKWGLWGYRVWRLRPLKEHPLHDKQTNGWIYTTYTAGMLEKNLKTFTVHYVDIHVHTVLQYFAVSTCPIRQRYFLRKYSFSHFSNRILLSGALISSDQSHSGYIRGYSDKGNVWWLARSTNATLCFAEISSQGHSMTV